MDRDRTLDGLLLVGKLLLTLIFFLNAFGVVDQARAAHEMAAFGVPAGLVPAAMWSGRIVQFIGGGLLLWRNDWLAAVACLLLAGFLAPATVIAHSFWSAPPELVGAQFVNFLKNAAIIGGLLCGAAFHGRGHHGDR